MNQITTLNDRYRIPGLSFEAGRGGLTKAVFVGPACSAEIYLHGAHVTKWQPAGHTDVLWVSELSWFEAGRPIRGGVPICFPWFGAHPQDATLPAHGTARLTEWTLTDACASPGGVRLILTSPFDELGLQLNVEFGATLRMELEAKLQTAAASPVQIEEALHTYFCVSDVRRILVSGLEADSYVDKMDGGRVKDATGHPLRFTEETDRVYGDSAAACVLHDPGAAREVRIWKSGSLSTVIWNPWTAKAARMPDFGDHEWPGMLCIETANVGTNSVCLNPGQSHLMAVEISVESAR